MLIILRGGGDLASGVAVRLQRSGFNLLITEILKPLAVRRLVSFSEAVYERQVEIEGVIGQKIEFPSPNLHRVIRAHHNQGIIPIMIDPDFQSLTAVQPSVVVDCRMLKSPLPGGLPEAYFSIGLGPGFYPGRNCHAAVETKRGHYLGRVYWEGNLESDTGEPDPVMGVSWDRVLRAPRTGILRVLKDIGSYIEEGDEIANIEGQVIRAKFSGVLRGILRDQSEVEEGMKIADLDPRNNVEYCRTVSDKSLAIGGGVLEAVLSRQKQLGFTIG